MVFGLVLAYLEGRKLTESLAAGLCASFIISSWGGEIRGKKSDIGLPGLGVLDAVLYGANLFAGAAGCGVAAKPDSAAHGTRRPASARTKADDFR